jgi:hypothetical protein
MRLNWLLDSSLNITQSEIQSACRSFYDKYKVVPDTVKMTYKDYSTFVNQMYQQSIQTLEKDKQYGLFVLIPGGLVELLLLEENDESVVGHGNNSQSIMVIESSKLDREFEKHVLKDN